MQRMEGQPLPDKLLHDRMGSMTCMSKNTTVASYQHDADTESEH